MKKFISHFLALIMISAVFGCHENPQQTADDKYPTSDNDLQSEYIDTTALTDENLPAPATNLEFWIAENVDNVDFSKYQPKYGIMGGQAYYGTGYIPTINEDGQQTDPKECVIYTVSHYPDYSDKANHITGIYITDPKIVFFGITLNSSFEEFESLIKKQGFKMTYSNENVRTAENSKFSVSFYKDHIQIRVYVENKEGIVF